MNRHHINSEISMFSTVLALNITDSLQSASEGRKKSNLLLNRSYHPKLTPQGTRKRKKKLSLKFAECRKRQRLKQK